VLHNAYELDNAPIIVRAFFSSSQSSSVHRDGILDQFRLFAKEPEADRLYPHWGMIF
jgi:hypothetical protein